MATPMFPLGTVLFPSMLLPLHVFEERYRMLMDDCLAGDREFGVVLIERGSEVGGGDVRTEVGTMARILEAEHLPDGRWIAMAAGVRRIAVDRWLGDDPYPRAEVSGLADVGASDPDLPGLVASARGRLDTVSALLQELDRPAPPLGAEVSPDPLEASYQLAALAPLGPLDSYRLLTAEGPVARIDRLIQMLGDAAAQLTAELAG